MIKIYQKPAMRVVKVQHRSQLLVGSDRFVNSTKTNFSNAADEINYAGGDEEYIQSGGIAR